MAFNGSGTYTRPAGQPVVSGTAISDTVFNTLTSDLATALSICVTRDGQSPATGNLPMGTYKLTGLGSGTAKTDSANYGQVQSSASKVITVAGTADVITGSLAPTLTAYVTGDMFSFVVGSTNTTNVTINLDGLGAKAVTNGTTALVAGELTANRVAIVQYDGTRFQLLNTALVLTNANLTGMVTSVGNAAVLGSFTIAQLNTAVSDANVAAAGANSDITSLTGLTTTLTVAQGGTGVATSTGTGANVLGTSPSISGAVLTTMASSVITSGTSQATTSGTSIDFTGIPSWVKVITLILNAVSTNGVGNFLVQIGSGSIETSGYVGQAVRLRAADNAAGAAFSTAFILTEATVAANTNTGRVTLRLLGSNLWVMDGHTFGGENYHQLTVGTKTTSGVLDRLRFSTPDTFDAGSVNILYE